MHGGYHFQQVGGNDVQLWGSSTTLFSSVSDVGFVKVATGTLNTSWQCADSQGFAYCLTSSRDTGIKTDGSVANTTYQGTIPLGTMLTFTPLQLAVAGVSANESTIYVSQQNSFLNFTVGVLPASSFTEPIASAGSRITHLAYYFGKLFWWKDQSFGYATFTNQFDWQLTIVSNQIGTLDNSDAFWNSSGFDSGSKFTGVAQANAEQTPGGIYFRGQDNHFYVYDGYYLTRISRVISPTVTAANRRKANAWAQTTQADFQNGTNIPAANISETISPGDVTVSSFVALENSSTPWHSGSATNISIFPSSMTLTTNNLGNITNNDFESSPWTNTYTVTATGGDVNQSTAGLGSHCTVSPFSGTSMAEIKPTFAWTLNAEIVSVDLSVIYGSNLATWASNQCNWVATTISSTGQVGKRFRLRFREPTSGDGFITKDSYTLGGDITIHIASDNGASGGFPMWIDDVLNGSSTISTGNFTSQTFDTAVSSSTIQLNTSFVMNILPPSFGITSSPTSNGSFLSVATTTGTNVSANRYVKYTATITAAGSDLPYITSYQLLSRSTGTYYSAVNNAPNITTWGIFNVDDYQPGASSITYYTRASTTIYTATSSTPTWVAQTKNSFVAASTGTYMQMRADFSLTAATETPTINDFQFNWFEGTAADKAYMAYFNDAIWFAVSAGTTSSTNNRIFYWDILNGAWSVYDIPSNGFEIENNALYFGSAAADGRVYKFGSVTTDNAASINSYWRSKAFLGQDPFVQNEFTQVDFVLGESSTTLSYTYTVDSKTSTVYTMTAYDSSASLIQRNFLLPVGKIGKYYDFKIGDNSGSAAWRLMGHRVHYNPLNWKPVLN